MSKLFFLSIILFGTIFFVGCGNDDDETNTPTTKNLTLNITGLEDLGSGYAYEGWLIVNGNPVTTGTFNVNGSGTLSKTSFELKTSDVDNASAFVLTIEPSPDSDPKPSSVHILAGDFSGSSAAISVKHSSAIGTDFTSATGSYILATPTDGNDMTNENSGVWWLNPSAGPGPGLSLDSLPTGWKYEGWAVINSIPVSTGTFSMARGSDDNSPFNGTAASAPPYPGEDLLMNAPSGLTFPTDLAGKTVVISVEPSPDNSPAPFVLKPLVGMVPANATDHMLYMMNNNATATNPKGTVTR